MPAYKIPRKIVRFEIFQPKTTLKSWLSKQNDKPDILFNASLYTSTNKPCGTIWNDGVMVSDQGNGFGLALPMARLSNSVRLTLRSGAITLPVIMGLSKMVKRLILLGRILMYSTKL